MHMKHSKTSHCKAIPEQQELLGRSLTGWHEVVLMWVCCECGHSLPDHSPGTFAPVSPGEEKQVYTVVISGLIKF